MNKLRHSGIPTTRQAAVMRSIVEDLQRTIQILLIDICTEKERVQVFDKADPLYSVLARTLTSRRDNLILTVADLEKRLYTIIQPMTPSIFKAA